MSKQDRNRLVAFAVRTTIATLVPIVITSLLVRLRQRR